MVRVRFTPMTPDRLVSDLAHWILPADAGRTRIGIDGADEIGAGALADAVAEELRALGRPAVRASTCWWLRPASLRLELGRTDVDMLRTGWVDSGALHRELLDPLGPGGSGSYLRRMRDPATDRSLRDARSLAQSGTVLVLDGPFLLAAHLPLDAVVHLHVSTATLIRSLPTDRLWWLEAFGRYAVEDRPDERAAVVVAYDHPAAPALAWADHHPA